MSTAELITNFWFTFLTQQYFNKRILQQYIGEIKFGNVSGVLRLYISWGSAVIARLLHVFHNCPVGLFKVIAKHGKHENLLEPLILLFSCPMLSPTELQVELQVGLGAARKDEIML